VPPYTVINRHIDYKFDSNRGFDVPVIGGPEPLFGKPLDEPAAAVLIDRGKMVIQKSRLHRLPHLFRQRCLFRPGPDQSLARSRLGRLASGHRRRHARGGDGQIPDGP
jgi:hypothetical protein